MISVAKCCSLYECYKGDEARAKSDVRGLPNLSLTGY